MRGYRPAPTVRPLVRRSAARSPPYRESGTGRRHLPAGAGLWRLPRCPGGYRPTAQGRRAYQLPSRPQARVVVVPAPVPPGALGGGYAAATEDVRTRLGAPAPSAPKGHSGATPSRTFWRLRPPKISSVCAPGRGAARPSLPLRGSPRPFCALRVLPPRGLRPWARPLRRGAPAPLRPLRPRPPAPALGLVRRFAAPAALAGPVWFPARPPLSCGLPLSGSPLFAPCSPCPSAWPRGSSRGPPPFGLRGVPSSLRSSARGLLPRGPARPFGPLIWASGPRGFGCAPAPARACFKPPKGGLCWYTEAHNQGNPGGKPSSCDQPIPHPTARDTSTAIGAESNAKVTFSPPSNILPLAAASLSKL